jgi:Tfp pilus assembly protein PilO
VQVLIVLLVIHAIVVLAFQQMPQVQQQMLHHLVALNVEFSEQYRVAKEMYAHCIFDEIQQHSLFL